MEDRSRRARERWPETSPHAASLPDLLTEQGGLVADLSPRIWMATATMDGNHRDPFDRLIVPIGIDGSLVLVCADPDEPPARSPSAAASSATR